MLKALRLEGRRTAVAGSSNSPGETADSAIGVTPAAMGVLPPSLAPNNLAFASESPNEVISFSDENFSMLRRGPWFTDGGDKGGLRSSGTSAVMLANWSWLAEGDVQGSVDSFPVQAKLPCRQHLCIYIYISSRFVHSLCCLGDVPSDGELLLAMLDRPLSPPLDEMLLSLPDGREAETGQ